MEVQSRRGSLEAKGVSDILLSVNNIEVAYHGVVLVLRGVSLEVPEGKIICLLGANGAGKTTTLKAISGLLHTEAGKVIHGDIRFNGRRLDKLGPESIVALGIIQVIEGRRVLEHLTVEENLEVASYVYGGAYLKGTSTAFTVTSLGLKTSVTRLAAIYRVVSSRCWWQDVPLWHTPRSC